MFKKWLLILGFSLFLGSTVNGQVVVKGPSEFKPLTIISLIIEKIDGSDLKVECVLTRSTGNESSKENWQIFKNLDDKYVVFLIPQENDLSYTFILACNDKQKTFLTTHTLKRINPPIIPPIDPPAPKPPIPPPTTDKLTLAYLQSPDSKALTIYINIIDDMLKRDFDNYSSMLLWLKEQGSTKLIPTQLSPLRDAVSIDLLNTLKDDPRLVNIPRAKLVFKSILDRLKNIESPAVKEFNK